MTYRFLVSVILIFLLISPAIAEKKQSRSSTMTPEEPSMYRVLSLAQTGTIIVHATQPEGTLFVEPLFWRKLTHLQKSILLKDALVFYQMHNSLKGTKVEWVGVLDMTTKETLGSINLETKNISIKK